MLRLSVRPVFGTVCRRRVGRRFDKQKSAKKTVTFFAVRPDYLGAREAHVWERRPVPGFRNEEGGTHPARQKGGKGRRPWMEEEEEEEEESCKRNLRRKRQKREREGWFIPPSRERERELCCGRPKEFRKRAIFSRTTGKGDRGTHLSFGDWRRREVPQYTAHEVREVFLKTMPSTSRIDAALCFFAGL